MYEEMHSFKDYQCSDKQNFLLLTLANYDNLPKCSQRVAALKLGISQSGLYNLLKNRDNISTEITANGNLNCKRK